jgi:pimeloyl-ACP methyl ester carboxylesterase
LVPISDDELHKKDQKPWFVYLQGGPGFGCRTPKSMPMTNLVLEKGYQMLYLDQRGTGLSTPITADTLVLQGNAQNQADYLKLFRADSIVKDCEAIRRALTSGYPTGLEKWSLFGQSFGGFCAMTYLSKSPQGLREVFTTGGIPPIGFSAKDVYKATFSTVIKRNEIYYQKYPEDIDHIHNLAFYIKSMGGIPLPSGGILTVRRFLTLGITFGGQNGIDTIHDLVLRMRSDLVQFNFITRPTLSEYESLSSFDDAVIYSVLHEAVYCQSEASNWAAFDVGKSLEEFKWIAGTPANATDVRKHPLYFSGEMIFPFMFETYSELEKLKEVADILAEYTGWPDLYDECQLARNEVPIYAANYVDDMYVNFALVQETVTKIRNCKQFITNTMYHDALRSQTESVLENLFKLRDDNMD